MDEFFSRSFDESNYTCWDFALEVWAHLTGQQMPRVLEAFNPEAMRSALDQCKVTFKPIPAAVSPCFVLFERTGTPPHVGIFHKGKVLHMNRQGVFYVPVKQAGQGFQKVSYYTC
jgi:1-deoxy-D-xylulose 5-phosphate reductoisomerase